MDSDQIKNLLEKYFEGNSSLAEEKILREYFLHHPAIPSELEYARKLFVHFDDEFAITLNEPIRNKIRGTNTRWIIRVTAIAAGVLLIIALWLIVQKPAQPTVYAYINGVPVTDKNIALSEANKALSLVSENLQAGTNGMNKLSVFNKYSRLIKKTR